jgi:hypothetical protein
MDVLLQPPLPPPLTHVSWLPCNTQVSGCWERTVMSHLSQPQAQRPYSWLQVLVMPHPIRALVQPQKSTKQQHPTEGGNLGFCCWLRSATCRARAGARAQGARGVRRSRGRGEGGGRARGGRARRAHAAMGPRAKLLLLTFAMPNTQVNRGQSTCVPGTMAARLLGRPTSAAAHAAALGKVHGAWC